MKPIKVEIEIESLSLPAGLPLSEYALRDRVRAEVIRAVSGVRLDADGIPQRLSPATLGAAISRAIEGKQS